LHRTTPRLRRVLGRTDLTFFLIAALINLNSVPVVAGAGAVALPLWILGLFFFLIPQSVAVIELSGRYPEEGGIYRWTKTAFGDFHGFMSGWCYWTNNIFYVPTLLFYMIGFAAFIGGDATAQMGRDPFLLALLSLVLLWIITGLNILGWGIGRWIQAIGATGTIVTTAILTGIGIVALRAHGGAALSAFALSGTRVDWRALSVLSVVCLNYTGLELGSVLGGEIKEPRRSIPRAALTAGLVTAVVYLCATAALQLTIPAQEIGVIDGILQGVKRAVTDLDLPWLVVPIALLMTLNAAGNTSAWLAGSARIPFVVGLDRYLPPALGRLHPRYETPWIALLTQSLASSAFILVTAIGASVHDMYLILLQTTIVLQLIPYLYMFAALVRVANAPGAFHAEAGTIRRPFVLRTAGVIGFVVTLGCVLFAFVPGSGVENAWTFEAKLILGTFGFILPAVVIYRIQSRRMTLEETGVPVEFTTD
jgi:glutamate:GABA antiporter